jgi:Arc/MetJ-type ribon-helix-helix transcriptional regulator
MTMLSFRVAEAEAAEIQRWVETLGLDRSEFLRAALHQHLVRLRSEVDATTWEQVPPTDAEQSLGRIADWGPAEDWGDWADAAG